MTLCKRILAASAAFLGTAALASAMVEHGKIKCESKDEKRRECKISNLDESSVKLVRQLSHADCINGRTWGTRHGYIWVDDGCRAEFDYELRGGGHDHHEGHGRREITCESKGDALHNCKIHDLDERSVRLERKLSHADCVNGRTWGTQPGLIWVESGCRAVFSYDTGHGHHGGSHAEADNPGRRHELTCESNHEKRRECKVDNLDLGSVTLERTLSHRDCHRDQNWGTHRGYIWVDDGCRAVFSYRVNR